MSPKHSYVSFLCYCIRDMNFGVIQIGTQLRTGSSPKSDQNMVYREEGCR